jgi:aldose 1-epimerase
MSFLHELDVLRNARVEAVINPALGARLASLQIDGLELLTEAGSFPMVPWAGRIRDAVLNVDGQQYQLPVGKDGNAIHGLARNEPWEQIGVGRYIRPIADPWPTRGMAMLEYQLLQDGIRTILTWDDGTDFPVSMGLHPWFNRRLDAGDDVELTFSPTRMVERDGALPTGRLVEPTSAPWDDCFDVDGDPVLTWPGALEVTLSSSSRWWVVFTEPEHAVCVEPQTAPPDAFHHDALKPPGGWPTSLTFEIRARSLRA